MALQTIEGTYVSSKEAAEHLGMAYGTFTNARTAHGDRFLRGHRHLVAGRVMFALADVARLAQERAA
jgi:hypothetical protein